MKFYNEASQDMKQMVQKQVFDQLHKAFAGDKEGYFEFLEWLEKKAKDTRKSSKRFFKHHRSKSND